MSAGNRATRAAGHEPASRLPPDERMMLNELWQISHFGWITEAAVRRSVIIASGRDVSPAFVAAGLRQLLERGWVEPRPSAANADEFEWRLTGGGRGVVTRR